MLALSSQLKTELETTIKNMTMSGKGLLAADESTGTIAKRFAAISIPATEDARRDYRELLLTTPNINQFISGVILHEETLSQKTSTAMAFSELLNQQNIVPGIKVDKGLVRLAGTADENITQGLDGLAERLIEFKNKGARFAKWRAVYAISQSTPSAFAIKTNAGVLANYAAICQEAGILPIVEPEILIDGEHNLEKCAEISEKVWHAVFHALFKHHVILELMILKPSMVIPGKNCSQSASPTQVAKTTVSILRRTVPAAVPSINFLSGGQTPEQATANLNAMHLLDLKLPWNLSFSYARALQEACMKTWQGKAENKKAAQEIFYRYAKQNSLASLGQYQVVV